MKLKISKEKVELGLDLFLFFGSLICFLFWFTGKGLFYSSEHPVLSPFTAFSLLLMSGSRLAEKYLEAWSKPMTLALLGIVACGNLSSMAVQFILPELFLHSMPAVVPTSIMTSVGLTLFCFYDILVVVRKTPQTAFILDDILIHLALFPGGLSLMGHMLDMPIYISSSVDPRTGISPLEMTFMGSYAVIAVLANPNLFLWKFLSERLLNRIIFALFFVNQYIAPFLVGYFAKKPDVHTVGIEFFVMLAGVLATLIFLIVNACCWKNKRT